MAMDNLPDLPALESVETADNGYAPIMLVFSGFFFFIVGTAVWAAVKYREFIETRGLVVVATILILAAWVVVRLLSSYLNYRTDTNGLTMKGVFRKRFIPWIDIKKATLTQTRIGESVLTIKTSTHTFKITPSGIWSSSISGDSITASTWQHLRRLNRADGITLSDRILSYWEDIPADIPTEIDWKKKLSTSEKMLTIVCILIFTVPIVALWFDLKLTLSGVMLSGFLTLCTIAMFRVLILPEILLKAYSVSVRKDCLEAKILFSKVYIPWSSVTSAKLWNSSSSSKLYIKSENPRNNIWIPYDLGDKQSEQLILAVIRYLRTAGVPQAIAIPTTISANSEILKQPSFSSERRGLMKRAFLNTLEQPAKKRIRSLWILEFLSVVVAVGISFWVMFTDALGNLSRWIHSGYGSSTRYFIVSDTIFLWLPIIFALVTICALIGGFIARKLAGEYLPIWREFKKVSPPSKFENVVGYILIVIAIAGVFMIPPFVDSYTRVTDDGIAINRFFKAGEDFYKWSQVSNVEVRQIVRGSGEKTCRSNIYMINFADGSDWVFNEDNVRWNRRKELQDAVRFVAAKTKQRLDTIY